MKQYQEPVANVRRRAVESLVSQYIAVECTMMFTQKVTSHYCG
jgi:hypothetical protein